jgi:hypothetical protein
MVATISANKEILSIIPTAKSAQQIGKAAGSGSSGKVDSNVIEVLAGKISSQETTDNIDLSVSHDVFSAVDNFFNMGRSGRFDAFHNLSPDDKEQFVRIVAELAKSGYMGFEELIVKNKVERHDVANQMGDERLHGAKVYDVSKYPKH